MTRNQTKSGKNKSKEQLAFMRDRKTGVPSRLKSPGAEQSREATNSPDDGGNLEAGESSYQRGEEQGSKSPSSLLFEPISPSSLNVYLTFSPSSLLFPPISPSSQLFSGHFSLLPILFLPPLTTALSLLLN